MPTAAPKRPALGLFVPLVGVIVLLVAAAYAGRHIVPASGPGPGADPPATALTFSPSGDEHPATPTPSPLSLPQPPPRPADTLAAWAARVGQVVDVPPVALQAYGYAQLLLARSDPTCRLTWTTLAGIGEVESAHGQANDAVLLENGRSDPLIIGPPLDGKGGRPLVPDSDAGAYDGDATYDRAMGPLRLFPALWRVYAADADADGVQDPYDIDDASLALARLLCSGAEDLSTRKGWDAALSRYRSGDTYARSVFAAADSYGQRTMSIR